MPMYSREDALTKFEHLSHLTHRINHARRAERGERLRQLDLDPRRGQGRILELLLLHDDLVQRDIAHLLGISPQSIGESLTKLEANGFIERKASERDKRALVVSLTSTGRALAQELDEFHRVSAPDPFEELTDDECAVLCDLLDKAIAFTEKQAAGLPEPEPPFGPRHGGPHPGGPRPDDKQPPECKPGGPFEHPGW